MLVHRKYCSSGRSPEWCLCFYESGNKTFSAMKKILVMLMVFAFMSGCEEDEPKVVTVPDVVDQVRTKLSVGRWHIQSVTDAGSDVTSPFDTYSFEFDSGGVLSAEDKYFTHFGTWTATRNQEDPNTADKVDVAMSFSSPEDFLKLNKTWRISTLGDSEVSLTSGSDQLHFTRAD
jgi:hypothetical protein